MSSCQENPQTASLSPQNHVFGDTSLMDIPLSHFNIPVRYSLPVFQAFINEKIIGEFLRADIHPTQNEKDVVHIVMRKDGNIRIDIDGDELICTIPLHLSADILQSRLYFLTKTIKPFDAYVDIHLSTKADLDVDWNLVTHLKLVGIRWKQTPMLDAGLLKFDLTKKIEQYITENEDKLTRLVDQKVFRSVSLLKPMSKVWYDMQKPIKIYKIAPQAWLQITPQNIAGNIVLKPKEIICYTSIDAKVAIITDTTQHLEKTPLPAFQNNNSQAVHSDVYVYAYSSMDEINQHVRRLLKGKHFEASGMRVTIEDLKAYTSDNGLHVLMKTSGSIEGDLIVFGMPVFDAVHQTIRVENFDFQLNSNSTLLNSGDMLLHDMIRDSVRAVLFFGMDTLIQKLPFVIEKAIGKGKKIGKRMGVNVENMYVHECDIYLKQQSIHFNIHTHLEAEISLRKLKTGKKMMIQPKKHSPISRPKASKKATSGKAH
jgi:hypothetical protein